MTPKEKAEELVDEYYLTLKESKGYYDLPNAKQCALIAVDEIVEQFNELVNLIDILEEDTLINLLRSKYYFYCEVKQEIKKL